MRDSTRDNRVCQWMSSDDETLFADVLSTFEGPAVSAPDHTMQHDWTNANLAAPFWRNCGMILAQRATITSTTTLQQGRLTTTRQWPILA